MFLEGTIINTLSVALGGTIGFLLGKKIPKNITKNIFNVIGIFTMILGISMAIKTDNFSLNVLALIFGTLIGEILALEDKLENLTEYIKIKIKNKNPKFTEAVITAFTLFCMGSLSIVGCIQEGMNDSHKLLITKSILDGFSAVILSSILGLGVVFAAVPLLIYQTIITLLAKYCPLGNTDLLINQISCIGGFMVMAIGNIH